MVQIFPLREDKRLSVQQQQKNHQIQCNHCFKGDVQRPWNIQRNCFCSHLLNMDNKSQIKQKTLMGNYHSIKLY